ncbi:hypothetical protein [Glutamicibacter arilaitensis]|uniref:hypothetical protein n=1 Tax=Glutamicibacter arilaitensis TaxID=256701 RepID=UPI003F90D30B
MNEMTLSVDDAWQGLRNFEVEKRSLAVEGQATRLLNELASTLRADGEYTALNLSKLARDTNLSRVTTKNSLDRLAALGVIEVKTVSSGRPINYAAYTAEFLASLERLKAANDR